MKQNQNDHFQRMKIPHNMPDRRIVTYLFRNKKYYKVLRKLL
jgi:hypothetical protein